MKCSGGDTAELDAVIDLDAAHIHAYLADDRIPLAVDLDHSAVVCVTDTVVVADRQNGYTDQPLRLILRAVADVLARVDVLDL